MQMNKLPLLLILLTCLPSCTEQLVEHDAIRQFINETNYEVEIKVFGDDEQYAYAILPLDTLNIEGVCTSGVEVYCDLGWVTTLNSATIVFGNERVQTFDGLPSDRTEKSINADPGLGYGYTFERKGALRIYTYRITEDDYENAGLIDG